MRRLLALALCLCCLTSCVSMLDRDAMYTSEHINNPPTKGDAAYRVNTYSGLCSALRSYVEEGITQGELRFPATYPGNLSVDLEKAKRQMMEEEPLGCYAVEDVTFHVDRIIAYYEVTATFDYRVEPQVYRAIETVRSDDALDAVMETALENFEEKLTLLLERHDATTTALDESLARVYGLNPQLALGCPQLEVTYYPEGGTKAVAEVKLLYPESANTLRLRQRNMLREAEKLLEELDDPDLDDAGSAYRFAMAAYGLVTERFRYDPEGGATAADALQNGAATDEGLARLWQLLCHLKGMSQGIFPETSEGFPKGYHGYVALPEGAATTLTFKPYAAQGGESQ